MTVTVTSLWRNDAAAAAGCHSDTGRVTATVTDSDRESDSQALLPGTGPDPDQPPAVLTEVLGLGLHLTLGQQRASAAAYWQPGPASVLRHSTQPRQARCQPQ